MKEMNDSIKQLLNIPAAVTEEIDILDGASDTFIKLVEQLETQPDLEQRAVIAQKYIKDNDGITEIHYDRLGLGLLNYNTIPLEVWRNLYVLERSIPPRFNNYTWLQRLKMFYNTYVREHAIGGKASYKGKKIYFLKGNAQNPTNHDRLVYGPGRWGPDFYFYDENRGETTWDKMVKVEMKHGNTDIEAEVKKHFKDKFLYNAKYLLLAMADGSYYMVNYNIPEAEITKLDITCPDIFTV